MQYTHLFIWHLIWGYLHTQKQKGVTVLTKSSLVHFLTAWETNLVTSVTHMVKHCNCNHLDRTNMKGVSLRMKPGKPAENISVNNEQKKVSPFSQQTNQIS